MILITFDKKSLPFGPQHMLAHFPQGRPRFTTQAVVRHLCLSSHILLNILLQVGMTATIRASLPVINAPKVYGYRDTLPNDINAEVVLLEKVEHLSFHFGSRIEACQGCRSKSRRGLASIQPFYANKSLR
jgi:hypothetical protein